MEFLILGVIIIAVIAYLLKVRAGSTSEAVKSIESFRRARRALDPDRDTRGRRSRT